MQFCQLAKICLSFQVAAVSMSSTAAFRVAGGRSQRPEAPRGQVQGRGSEFRQSPGSRDPRRDLGRHGARGLGRGTRGRSAGRFPERRQSGSFSEEAYGDSDDWGAGSSTWETPLQVNRLQILLSRGDERHLLVNWAWEQIRTLPVPATS